jgi:cytochrome c oxidase assembly protein subunit 15
VEKNSRFTLFAWVVLGWNVLVVLWGAVVRATGAGAGCGSHWPLCNGDVLPQAPAVKTLIEFAHRVTSGLALVLIVVLLIWALRLFPKRHAARRYATLSFILIIVEALLGAGLVLLRYVEHDQSVGRAVAISLHLANTLLLLGALTCTAWFSRPEVTRPRFAFSGAVLGLLLPLALIVGITGAIAALGDTLFPATSFSQGMQQDVSDTAHFLLRLRVFHPAFAIILALYGLIVAADRISTRVSCESQMIASIICGVIGVQLLAGFANLLLLAPVWLQITHLLLADILWVLFVILVAEG